MDDNVNVKFRNGEFDKRSGKGWVREEVPELLVKLFNRKWSAMTRF